MPNNLKNILLLIIIVLLGGLILLTVKDQKLETQRVQDPDPEIYQVVFLSNGQSYYGHLKDLNSRFPVLTDVFYLKQKIEAVEVEGIETAETRESAAPVAETAPKEPQFDLMKLGTAELNGSEDVIYINNSHLLFWENLESTSEVLKVINQYITEGSKSL